MTRLTLDHPDEGTLVADLLGPAADGWQVGDRALARVRADAGRSCSSDGAAGHARCHDQRADPAPGPSGEGGWAELVEAPGEAHVGAAPAQGSVLGCLLHLSDLHVCDAESPARQEYLDHHGDPGAPYAGRLGVIGTYRPQEILTVPVVAVGAGRGPAAVRGPLTGAEPDAVLLTGDVTDNAQRNELAWYAALMAGEPVAPAAAAACRAGSGRAAAARRAGGRTSGTRTVRRRGSGRTCRPCATATRGCRAWPRRRASRSPHPAPGSRGSPCTATTTRCCRAPSRRPRRARRARHRRAPGGRTWPRARRRSSCSRAPHRTGRRGTRTPRRRRAWPSPRTRPGAGRGDRLRGSGGPDGSGGLAPPAGPGRPTSASSGWWRWTPSTRTAAGRARSTPPSSPGSTTSSTRAADRYVVVTSHHPSWTLTNGHVPPGASPRHLADDVVALLLRHRCVVAWLSGHVHRHTTQWHQAPDRPGGLWEVTTASLVDWPQQWRVVEVVRERGTRRRGLHGGRPRGPAHLGRRAAGRPRRARRRCRAPSPPTTTGLVRRARSRTSRAGPPTATSCCGCPTRTADGRRGPAGRTQVRAGSALLVSEADRGER